MSCIARPDPMPLVSFVPLDMPMDDMLSFVDGCEMILDVPDGAFAPLPKAPKREKPKRVRRETREISTLRQQIEKLELQLADVKTNSKKPVRSQGQPTPADSQRLAIKAALWKRVIKRQLHLRSESENENARLQSNIEKLTQVRRSFEMIISNTSASKIAQISNSRKASSFNEYKERVFLVEQQVAALELSYMQLDARLRRSELGTMPAVFSDVRVVQSTSNRLVLDVRAQRELTFDLPTASHSMWQFFSGKTVRQVFHREEKAVVSDHIVTRSYCSLEHKGQHTMQKYERDERTAFVWTTRLHQSETPNSLASGFLVETQGQLVVWKTTRHRAPTTAMQMYCRATFTFTNSPRADASHMPKMWVNERVRMVQESYADMTTHMIREISTEDQLRKRLSRSRSDSCSS